MSALSHHLRVGKFYVLQALKSRMEYRADFFVECVTALLQQASGLLMLEFLFQNFSVMKDWTRDEVFFIYGFSLIPMAIFDSTSASFYMFSDKYVVQGELDRVLLRPLSSLFQIIMEGLNFEALADLVLGIAVLSYAWSKVGPPIDAGVVLQFALCVFGAWGVLAGVFLTLTSLCFWSQDRMSLLPPVYNLLNFARYPLNIYRPFVRLLLTWVIPFGFVAFYPSAAFLKRGAEFIHLANMVPVAGLLTLAVGGIAWRIGLRRYAGAGS